MIPVSYKQVSIGVYLIGRHNRNGNNHYGQVILSIEPHGPSLRAHVSSWDVLGGCEGLFQELAALFRRSLRSSEAISPKDIEAALEMGGIPKWVQTPQG